MTKRRIERLKKAAEKRCAIRKLLGEHGKDILCSDKFRSSKNYVQHGNMSVNQHCKNVALASLTLNRALHLKGDTRDIVRGALLHDYFLYDWHTMKPAKGERLHGFTHAGTALKNADRDYNLTDKQKDIIGSHMWPLNIKKIPRCKEAWTVTAADKYCSLMETLKIHKGVMK